MSKTPKFRTAQLLAGVMSAAIVVGWAAPSTAQEETFKIGVVTFLSGQAAQSFGVPAWNGGQVLIEKLNAGEAPAPYDTKGFGGMAIEAVVLDELKQFTILYDCGTPRIFEENDYDYVFRTAANATMDNVGLALYLKALGEEVSTYSGINQDYAFGQDSWADFKAAMGQVYPDATVTAELFPAFGAGQYGTEISALMQKRADVVHSSLWGGDLQALILQALPRGLFQRSQAVLSASDHVLPPLGNTMPEGVIIGARGAYGYMAPESELDTWWKDIYETKYDVFPVQAPYRMAQAILGLKTAVEKAMAENGGKKPNSDELAAAMKGLSWETPGGLIEMTNGKGHQAIQQIGFGRTVKNDEGDIILGDVIRFPARCVNAPEDVKGLDWINGGFEGAQCD
jgi:branched-chain amino acid transport system substrate-binding protein